MSTGCNDFHHFVQRFTTLFVIGCTGSCSWWWFCAVFHKHCGSFVPCFTTVSILHAQCCTGWAGACPPQTQHLFRMTTIQHAMPHGAEYSTPCTACQYSAQFFCGLYHISQVLSTVYAQLCLDFVRLCPLSQDSGAIVPCFTGVEHSLCTALLRRILHSFAVHFWGSGKLFPVDIARRA